MNIMDQMVLGMARNEKHLYFTYMHTCRWLSVIIYTVFLFLVLTVLLNLLIAQMSDTYANVQSDAQRALVMNRAWIVAKAEYNSLFTSALFVSIMVSYQNVLL